VVLLVVDSMTTYVTAHIPCDFSPSSTIVITDGDH